MDTGTKKIPIPGLWGIISEKWYYQIHEIFMQYLDQNIAFYLVLN